MSKNETIEDIVRDMRINESGYSILHTYPPTRWETLCCRIEAAYNRKVEAMDGEIGRVIADRNALAEKNRACCDENERLREALEPILGINLEEASNAFYAGARAIDELSIAIANAQSKMATKEANDENA